MMAYSARGWDEEEESTAGGGVMMRRWILRLLVPTPRPRRMAWPRSKQHPPHSAAVQPTRRGEVRIF